MTKGSPTLFISLGTLILLALVTYTLPHHRGTGPLSSSPMHPPDFTSSYRKSVPQFEGKALKSSDLKGKWFLLNFWAYWCLPCLQEMPTLQDLAANWNGPELEIITINTDEPQSENFELAKKFLQESNMTLPSFFDSDGKLKNAFTVTEVPRHFLINPNGEIIWQALGTVDWAQPEVKRLLLKALEPSQTQELKTSEE